MTKHKTLLLLMVTALVWAFGGCSKDKGDGPSAGASTDITLRFLKSSLTERVDLMKLRILQGDLLVTQEEAAVVDGNFSFPSVTLPIGDYTFVVDGVEIEPNDEQTVLYAGVSDVTIHAGNNSVAIDVQPVVPMVRIAPYNLTAPATAVFTTKLEFWNIPTIRSGSFDIPYDAGKLRFVSADIANEDWGILHVLAEATENHLTLSFERLEGGDEVPLRHDIIDLKFSGISAGVHELTPNIVALADDEGDITEGLSIYAESQMLTIIGGGTGDRGLLTGYVTDATNGTGLAGAIVSISGPENHQTITDDNGLYIFEDLLRGTYEVTAGTEGYISLVRTVVHDASVTTAVFALSQQLQTGQYRIVLSWGTTPSDLDAHIWTTIDQNTYEVYYGNEGSSTTVPFMLLDTDDQDGFGPETITIYQITSPGIFAVHNYSEEPSIIGSNATIEVYSGNQKIGSYSVPTTGQGLWWYVFDISPQGQLTVHNTLSDNPPVASQGAPARSPKASR